MNVQTGYLQNVDGSCLYSLNSTKVISSVTGPIEPKPRQELPTQLSIEINLRPAVGVPTTREITVQDKIRMVIAPIIASYKFPRQLCQITLQLLQSGETESHFNQLELAACINSTVFALVDSGLPLKNLAIATTIVIDSNNNIIHENITDEILKNKNSAHVVVYKFENNEPSDLLLMDSHGDFDEDDVLKVLEAAKSNVRQLNKSFRDYIQSKLSS